MYLKRWDLLFRKYGQSLPGKHLRLKRLKMRGLLLQSGLSNLEDAIGDFLSSEKGRIVLNTAISKLKRIHSSNTVSDMLLKAKRLQILKRILGNKINTFHRLNANLDRRTKKILLI